MDGDEPRDGEQRSITGSFNNRRSGKPMRERTEPAGNGYSGHVPTRDYDGPQVTSIGTDIGNFFRVLFAFFKGIWTQDFADFDLLSSVYFPPQPESKEQQTAGTERRTGTLPRVQPGPTTATASFVPTPGVIPSQTSSQSKLDENFNSSSGSTPKPSEETAPPSAGSVPESRTQETGETKTHEQTAIEKSVQAQQEMRANPDDPRWKLPLFKLKDELTKDIPHLERLPQKELGKLTKGLENHQLAALPRKMILNMIAGAESSGNYNIAQGGRHAKFTSMTVKEVMQWQKDHKGEGESTAVGRYQIIAHTLEGLVQKHKIPLNAKFDERMQDRLGNHLIDEAGFKEFAGGKMSTATYMYNLAAVWAGVPKDSQGMSYYQGIGSNKATISPETVLNTLGLAKQVGEEITRRGLEISRADHDFVPPTPKT